MIFQKQGSLFIGKFASFLNEPAISHGISTRKGGVSHVPYDSLNLGYQLEDSAQNVNLNRERFLASFQKGEADVVQANQVHDIQIKTVTTPGTYDNVDGFLTHTPDLPLTIRVADCMPIFLYDPDQKVIGLIHAGWRGTAKKIIQKAIALMVSEFHSKCETIKAALGPSIGSCCYQIKDDVASQFPHQYVHNHHLDIGQYNFDQLLEAGLMLQNIEKNDLCTCCYQEWFFSHRGSQGNTGRMLAFLSIKHSN